MKNSLHLALISLGLACLSASAGAASGSQFHFPTTGLSVGSPVTLLAIDDVAWPFRRDLGTYLTKPTVRRAPVLAPSHDNPSAPDFLAAHLYGSVIQTDGKFQMWYYAVGGSADGKDLVQGPVCYAESADGLAWSKPDLGQVEFKGSRHNNIIALPAGSLEGVQVIRDDEDPDASRRFKLIFNPAHPVYHWTMRSATSPDGLHWTPGPEAPIRHFLEFSSLYKHGGTYFINAHIYGRGVEGRMQGREAYVWRSPDFTDWMQELAPSFALPEPASGTGPSGRYDQDHLGVGAASLGNVAIGLYGIWHERGWGVGGTTCDFGLVLSQDGVHFYEPVRGYVFLSPEDSPVTPVPGKNYPTILTQSNSILNYGDETRIYHGRWRNAPDFPAPGAADYWGEVALATLPRDRWGALALLQAIAVATEPGNDAQARAMGATESGTAWSMPVTLPTDRDVEIALNADDARGLRVELADAEFHPLPGYAGPASGATEQASGLDCPVKWSAATLHPLRGRTVRLHLLFAATNGAPRPRCYAVYLRAP